MLQSSLNLITFELLSSLKSCSQLTSSRKFQIAADDEVDEDMLEMAPLANRFSFFENFKEKEEEKKKQRKSPHREVNFFKKNRDQTQPLFVYFRSFP